VEAIIAEAAAAGPVSKRVVRARVKVGDLRQIVPDTLQFAYETLTKDTCADSSVLEIVRAPATGVCALCAWEGELQGPVIGFICAKCGAIEGKLTGGRELFLESIEVVDNE